MMVVGPPLSAGPLPTLFYFALSAEDSLYTAPYNQPVTYLALDQVRVVSMTLPGHGPGLKDTDAFSRWAYDIGRGHNPLHAFLEEAQQQIQGGIAAGWIDPSRLAVAGLSRGAFVATHLAAREKQIGAILGYAPLTHLEETSEFLPFQHHPIVKSIQLRPLYPSLIGRPLLYLIGNYDTRVGTEKCFQTIQELTEASIEAGIRTPPVELIIGPSIGHKGHGTPPERFKAGIDWLRRQWSLK